MFKEQFYEGPGSETMATYIWEIALILLGAFLLGYLLRLMLNSRLKNRIAELEHKLAKDNVSHMSQSDENKLIDGSSTTEVIDAPDYELQIQERDLKLETLNAKLKDLELEKSSCLREKESLVAQVAELKEDLRAKSSDEAWPVSYNKIMEDKGDHFPESDVNDITKKGDEVEITLGDKSTTSQNADSNTEVADTISSEKNESTIAETKVGANHAEEIASSVMASGNESISDNLKRIEGIGPKIEQLLNGDGIFTFKELMEADLERVKAVLIAAGPNYAVHDPGTWAEQSKLAYEGKWEALDQLQEQLKGGKRKKK